jgi:hypothetical protein
MLFSRTLCYRVDNHGVLMIGRGVLYFLAGRANSPGVNLIIRAGNARMNCTSREANFTASRLTNVGLGQPNEQRMNTCQRVSTLAQ